MQADFLCYPSVTGPQRPNRGIAGDFRKSFWVFGGTVSINAATVSTGVWSDTSITNARVPGQTGKTSDKIIVARSGDINGRD